MNIHHHVGKTLWRLHARRSAWMLFCILWTLGGNSSGSVRTLPSPSAWVGCASARLKRRGKMFLRVCHAHPHGLRSAQRRGLALRAALFSGALGRGARFAADRQEGGEEQRPVNLHVVLPCLNEERALPSTLGRLCNFLEEQQGWNWEVTVVDNGSTDGTSNVTRSFALNENRVSLMRLEERGRGRALCAAWLNSTADIQSYMDVDLSTDLNALPKLVQSVATSSADIAVASRNAPGAAVQGRSAMRSLTSRGLSFLIRAVFWRFSISDTQCGCKVLSRSAAHALLPQTRNQGWFFDTEMLLLAHAANLRVQEFGVVWRDDRDSRVKVLATITEMLLGLGRMRLALWGESLRVLRVLFWRIQGEVRVLMMRGFLRVRRLFQRLVLFPTLRGLNRVITLVDAWVPDDRNPRIDTSGLLRAGWLQWLGIKSFADRHMPGLSNISQKLARRFLSMFDEGQLMGLISMAGTELIAREVQRQIEPLPPDIQDKAVNLSGRVIQQLETKLVEFGEADWLMDVFVNTELQRLPGTISKILNDPLNSLPILQEPDAREAVALILQAKAEVEARRVLRAIGLTEQQSRLFLKLNATAPVAAPARTLPFITLSEDTEPGPAALSGGVQASGASTGGADGLSVGPGPAGASGNFSTADFSPITNYLKVWETEVSQRYTRTFDLNADGMVSWQELWESIYGVGANSSRVGDESRAAPIFPAVRVPSRSLAFLDKVQSEVAINPSVFSLLRDAAELTLLKDMVYKDNNLTGFKLGEEVSTARATMSSELQAAAAAAVSNLSVALTRRLEDEVSPYVKTVDASFNSLVDQVENSLAESMRALYYTQAGKPRESFKSGVEEAEVGEGDGMVQKMTRILEERVVRKVHREALPAFEWGFNAIDQARAKWVAGEVERE